MPLDYQIRCRIDRPKRSVPMRRMLSTKKSIYESKRDQNQTKKVLKASSNPVKIIFLELWKHLLWSFSSLSYPSISLIHRPKKSTISLRLSKRCQAMNRWSMCRKVPLLPTSNKSKISMRMIKIPFLILNNHRFSMISINWIWTMVNSPPMLIANDISISFVDRYQLELVLSFFVRFDWISKKTE